MENILVLVFILTLSFVLWLIYQIYVNDIDVYHTLVMALIRFNPFLNNSKSRLIRMATGVINDHRKIYNDELLEQLYIKLEKILNKLSEEIYSVTDITKFISEILIPATKLIMNYSDYKKIIKIRTDQTLIDYEMTINQIISNLDDKALELSDRTRLTYNFKLIQDKKTLLK